jgi:hypothetical protein
MRYKTREHKTISLQGKTICLPEKTIQSHTHTHKDERRKRERERRERRNYNVQRCQLLQMRHVFNLGDVIFTGGNRKTKGPTERRRQELK